MNMHHYFLGKADEAIKMDIDDKHANVEVQASGNSQNRKILDFNNGRIKFTGTNNHCRSDKLIILLSRVFAVSLALGVH